MKLKEQISEDLKSAMKNKDSVKLNILRVLKGEIERNEQTATKRVELSDGDILKLVKKMIEGIKETKGSEDEINTLEIYMPQQLSMSEVKTIASSYKDIQGLTGQKDMGKIMSHFKDNYGGRYDGKVLSDIAKEILS